MAGRTCLVIAIASPRGRARPRSWCSRPVGQSLSKGSHDQLMARDGRYVNSAIAADRVAAEGRRRNVHSPRLLLP